MPTDQKHNVQPLFTGTTPGALPLTPGPYYSRVEEQELAMSDDGVDAPKNYQMVAFRPGFPLQASELNEIQEHFQMQMSLSISMMHNWITSGLGKKWGDWHEDSIGGGAIEVPVNVPNTGIGVGGGINAQGGTYHDTNYAVSGPGWIGATPLYPFNYPYQGYNVGGGLGPVTVQQVGSSRFDVSIWGGWWLVDVGGWWDGSGEARDGAAGGGGLPISGLKHWVFLSGSNPAEALYTVQVQVDSNADVEIPIGFKVISKYYSCCQTADGDYCDPELADNANGGEPNDVSCGASRYGIEVVGAAAVNNTDGDWGSVNDSGSLFAQREELSLICKVNPAQRTVRYINNLLITDLS